MDSMTNSLQNINDETSRITTSMESADTTPSASPGETGRYNTATIADFNRNISLKNISPRREGEIKNLSQQREEISRASDGGANVVPSSTNSDSYVGGAPVSAGRSSDGANIAQESQNVNEDVKYKLNPEHEAQVRAYNEHITRLRQREEYLRGQGMSENAPAMINLRKAQEQAIYARDHIGEVDENGLKYKLSPEQEAFFKDSKVRDEDGNLMKMYHGSPNGHITEFRPGTYFTKNEKYADRYQNPGASSISLSSSKEINDPKTYEVYINSKNPFTLNDSRAKDIFLNEYVKGGNSFLISPYTDPTEINSLREIDWTEGEDFMEWLRENHPEYDSLYLDEGGDGGYGEKTIDRGISLVMTKPEQIKYTDNLSPTDSPDMRYKLGAKMQELASQNKLLARHLQLTGDENLVFNEWQNEMQKRALGYYDPKTDQINLNKLTEDTLNHELGHKILTRVENKQDLLNSIRESYGDDYLINKYGNQYGNDLNLLAEEQLADGFSDYYNGRLKGEDKVRLGARLGIPQKVLAVYDRITEAIMGLVGKQDAIKQFYAQMETGKFRDVSQVGARATKPQPTYRIDPNTNIVHLDEGYSIPPNTRTGDIGRIIRGRIRQFINQDFDLGESGIQARVTSDTINEVSNKQPSMRHWQFVKKGEMSNNFNELLNAMQNVRVEEMNPAKANQKGKIRRNADYYIKGDVIVDVGGDLYEATIVNEVDKLGNVLAYDISGIRKSTGRGLDSSAISADALDQSIDNSSIPNNPQDVNDENSHITCSMESAEANPYTLRK